MFFMFCPDVIRGRLKFAELFQCVRNVIGSVYFRKPHNNEQPKNPALTEKIYSEAFIEHGFETQNCPLITNRFEPENQ